jgi:hypothetical protein
MNIVTAQTNCNGREEKTVHSKREIDILTLTKIRTTIRIALRI